MRTRNCKESGGSFLLFYFPSHCWRLKSIYPCPLWHSTTRLHLVERIMWDSIQTSVLSPLFLIQHLHSLVPVGDSLPSHFTSMPLLCLLLFLFMNIKMEWLHPFTKFLSTSSEIPWITLALIAAIIVNHFHLLLVNILLCMGLPVFVMLILIILVAKKIEKK